LVARRAGPLLHLGSGHHSRAQIQSRRNARPLQLCFGQSHCAVRRPAKESHPQTRSAGQSVSQSVGLSVRLPHTLPITLAVALPTRPPARPLVRPPSAPAFELQTAPAGPNRNGPAHGLSSVDILYNCGIPTTDWNGVMVYPAAHWPDRHDAADSTHTPQTHTSTRTPPLTHTHTRTRLRFAFARVRLIVFAAWAVHRCNRMRLRGTRWRRTTSLSPMRTLLCTHLTCANSTSH
jgi:hypothetical protein